MIIIRQKAFSKFKGSRKLAEKVISEGGYSPHIFGNKPTDEAIKRFRTSNSPLSMRNGSYPKDAKLGKRDKLNLKISIEDPELLRRQAGGKIPGKGTKILGDAITKDGRAGYTGGYIH